MIRQENMLAIVCTETTQSKPIKPETSRTYSVTSSNGESSLPLRLKVTNIGLFNNLLQHRLQFPLAKASGHEFGGQQFASLWWCNEEMVIVLSITEGSSKESFRQDVLSPG